MRQNLKFILPMVVLLVMAIVSFSSCEKEEYTSSGGSADSLPNVIYAPVKGENFEWSFNTPAPQLSKGYYIWDYWDLGTAYDAENESHTFQTLKVYRRNDPDKYFYVMLTNLDIKVSEHCWAYEDNNANVRKYGYLYTWMKANELASRVYMELPYRNPRNGRIGMRKTAGRLMTFEDLKDILESDVVPEQSYDGDQLRKGELPSNDGDFYYDAFVFGPNRATDFDVSAQHSLAGSRVPEWFAEQEVKRYDGLNSMGYFWLAEKEYNPDYHYFLYVQRRLSGKRYSLFVNHMIRDYNGLAVRYVFEPNI